MSIENYTGLYKCNVISSDTSSPTVDTIKSQTKLDEYESQSKNIDVSIGMSCISICRYITDNFKIMSESAVQQVMERNDFPVLLVDLLEKKPWVRKGIKGEKERWEDNAWVSAEKPTSKLSKIEGQIWIALFNMVMDGKARNSYELNSYRKEQILKVKG